MADVSNKTIVALLAIALVITVVGTVVSVGKLNSIGGRYSVLTGAATEGTGTTSITVQGTAALVINTSSITLYSGYYNTSCSTTFSTIDTGITDNNSRSVSCWVNTSGTDNQSLNYKWHEIANSGTTAVNITAYVTASSTTGATSSFNSTEILCGVQNCPSANANAIVRIKASNNESNSCSKSLQSGYSTYYASLLNTSGQTNVTLCQSLNFDDSSDELNTYFYVQLPSDADQGAKGFTVTYYATAR